MPIKITHKPSSEVRFRDLSAGDKFVVDNLEFVKLNWDAPTAVELTAGEIKDFSRDSLVTVAPKPQPTYSVGKLPPGTYIMNQGKIYLIDSDGWAVDLITGSNIDLEDEDDPKVTLFVGTIEVTDES